MVYLYIPTYGSTQQKQQIGVQYNKRILIENGNSECAKKPPVKWVGGYATIGDIVFEKPDFISAGKLDNYSYHSKGIMDYNGRRTYVLNFSGKGAKVEGVIYIDSLTKAFSAIEYTRYNIHRFLFIPITIGKGKYEYKLCNGKWYINRMRRHTVWENDFVGFGIQEFQSLEIDSVDAKPIPYSERVQYMDIETAILKKDTVGNTYDTLMAKYELDSTLTVLPIPKRKDSVRLKRGWSKAKLYSLLLAIKPAIALRNVPITTGHPFYVPNSIGVEYAFSTYKNLFTRLGFYENYGIGSLKIQYLALSFEREIINNINHRPIRIIPHSGFSFLFSKEKRTSNSNSSINYIVGVRVAIEIRRGMSFFIDGDYVKNLKKTGSISDFTFREISLSTGLMFHLKQYK